jgi:hypothetical protein
MDEVSLCLDHDRDGGSAADTLHSLSRNARGDSKNLTVANISSTAGTVSSNLRRSLRIKEERIKLSVERRASLRQTRLPYP